MLMSNPMVPDARDPKHLEDEASANAETAPDAFENSPNALLHRLAMDQSLRLLDHGNRLLPQSYKNDGVEAAFQAHYVRIAP